jgi:hypothetical protein
MKIIYRDGSTLNADFVVPTVDEALSYIREGAINGVELLEEAGLSPDEAERQNRALQAPGYVIVRPPLPPPEGKS